MAKGVLGGVAAGVLVSGLGLGTLSLIAPPPAVDLTQAAASGFGSGPAAAVSLPIGTQAEPVEPNTPVAEPTLEPRPSPEAESAPRPEAGEDTVEAPAPSIAPEPSPAQEEGVLALPPQGETVTPPLARPLDEGTLALPEEGAVDPFAQTAPETAPDTAPDSLQPDDGLIVIDAPSAPAGTPAGSLQNAPGTVVNRLPTISATAPRDPYLPPPDGAVIDPATLGQGATLTVTPTTLSPEALSRQGPSPLDTFATPFTPSEGAYFTVVLLDPGSKAGGLDQSTVLTLGIPVTVAIDPTRPRAAEDAKAYRAAGYEVAILASALPQGASAQDVEVALEAWRQVLPEAVAVVEGPEPIFQNNRNAAQAMTRALAREGLALVTQTNGLNAAEQLAKSSGLPNAKIWRVLDTGREKAPTIDRMLDRAAFEADRMGAVAVMLSTWPESVTGLLQWTPPAGTQLAPLSALARKPAPAPL